MKLKLVVASMSILGLVSCPVFAATTDTDTATTTHKKTHHRYHHKAVKHEVVDYKDMAAAAPEVCIITQPAMIMDEMTQSMGRSMPNPCNPGWFNRIRVSGGINVDLGKFGNRNANIMGENYQRFSLNDAYLNIGADINEWAKAFASLSFSNPTTNSNPGVFSGFGGGFGAAEYSAAYSNNINGNSNNVIQLEQAYATIGNFDVTPFFLQLGKQFQDFSRYEIHPITASMTQVMSEVLATSLKLGFVANGFNGSLYAFDDPINKNGNSSKPTNYGLALGYDAPSDQFGWDVGAAYLYNLIGANDVAYNVVNFNTGGGALASEGGYRSRVGGVAVYADINSGPFILGARYTTAVQRFNPLDLPKDGIFDVSSATSTVIPSASGAKPWAAGIQAGYGFEGWGRNQNVYLGYQASREAAGLDLPKSRWLVGYGIDAFGKNTNVGIEWDHDNAYSFTHGGTGNTTNLVSLRAGVKFG